MLTRDLISNSIPYLHKEDKVYHALQLMNDYHVAHLPVVENNSYLGIISEEQLLQSDDSTILNDLPISDGHLADSGLGIRERIKLGNLRII